MLFKLGELFSGPGGIASGVSILNKKLGYEAIKHTWATDYHKESCETYQNNFFPNHPEKVICQDIKTIQFDQDEVFEKVNALTFGFPCNDFSIVGKSKGLEGEFGPLYKYCVDAVNHFQPDWFIAENVGGLRSSNNGGTLSLILNSFRDCGYTLTPHFYKFEEYGVPQRRHRIIIVGIKNTLNIKFRVPKPSGKIITASEALKNIASDAANNELTRQSATVVERLKHIKPWENAFTATLPPHLRLNINGAKISQIYKRLHPDKPSYTVTGSGGGGTHVYHWSENRALTNRERARLQSFPDSHIFSGSKESVRRQVGMAIPPVGIEIVLKAIVDSFNQEQYDSIDNNIKV